MTDINEALDKRAITLASFIPRSDDDYLENIRIAAMRLNNAGLGDMVYVTQYSSGSTVWQWSKNHNAIMMHSDGFASF